MKATGEAAEELARKLQIPGPIARKMGDALENIAGKALPMLARSAGWVGVVIGSTVGIMKLMEERKKAQVEAIDRSVASLESEVNALYRNEKATEAMARAQYNYLAASREIMILDPETKINNMSDALNKQSEAIAHPGRWKSWWGAFTGGWGESIEDFNAAVQKGKARAIAELQKAIADLQREMAKLDRLKGKLPTYKEWKGGDDSQKELRELEALRQTSIRRIEEAQKLRQKDAEEERKAVAEWMEIRRKAVEYDISLLHYEETEREYALQREKERREQMVSIYTNYADAMVNITEAMYLAMNEKSRTMFEIMKAARIAQATVAAIAAVIEIWAEPSTSMSIRAKIAMTVAVAAKLAAMIEQMRKVEYTGGGSHIMGSGSLSAGGGTAAGSNPYLYYSYEQSQYGTGWRPGEGGGPGSRFGVTHNWYIQGDLNDADKFKEKVIRAWSQDMFDNGKSRSVMRRFAFNG